MTNEHAEAALAALEAEKVCEAEMSCDANGCKQDRAYGEGIRMAKGTIYGTGLDDQTQFVWDAGSQTSQVPQCPPTAITADVLNYKLSLIHI